MKFQFFMQFTVQNVYMFMKKGFTAVYLYGRADHLTKGIIQLQNVGFLVAAKHRNIIIRF